MKRIIIYFTIINFILVNGGECFQLTIVHNNDVHSHFDQTNVWGNECDNKTKTEGKCFGGAARTVTMVKMIKNSRKNVLFLNAGDYFQGTLWYVLYKWKVVAEFVKIMKHDAMTIGNHEFDDGPDGLASFLKNISTPVICSNIDVSNEPKLIGTFKKSIVLSVDNHSIGIIGYTTQDTVFLDSPGNTVKFTDEIKSIKEEVNAMKKSGVKIIIGLGHSGLEKDIEIAKQIPDLDIIVGGHSHTFLYTGPKPSIEEPYDKYPIVIKHNDNRQTLIVTAFWMGKYLGNISLEFDNAGNIIKYHGNPILLDHNVPEDTDVLKLINEYETKTQKEFGKIIGKTAVLLEGRMEECRMRECNMGNVITDSMIQYYLNKKHTEGWTHAAVAVTNSGGINTGTIDEKAKNGSITLEQVMNVLPHRNPITMVEMNGKVMKQMLEHSVSNYDISGLNPSGRFLQMSGIKVEYDLRKPVNNRVVNTLIRCANCRIPIYENLNDNKIYRVIMPKYLTMGGDDYTMLKSNDVKRIEYEDLDVQILIDYVSSKSPLWTGIEQRIVLKT